MSFNIEELRKARLSLERFRANAVSPHHDRYIFPFFAGSYFAYRKVDVMRLVAIAQSISDNPNYLDVGCGYGDFLKHVREFLPGAIGIEKDAGIFYALGMSKPEWIRIADAHMIDGKFDLVFVAWMEPGQDFRDAVARSTDIVVTTLDQGISLAAEYDGHGFEKAARWRTPSWEDVNTEIMNRYYTKMPQEKRAQLGSLRGAHNLWYVYSRPEKTDSVRAAVERQLQKEPVNDRYDFEDVLDECGYRYLQKLESCKELLWHVQFE